MEQNILISAEAIGSNRDLLTEILLRLPVKPLGKFKCVSKQWLSLISDPTFCLSHTRHHLTHAPTALLLMKDYYSTPELQIVPLKQDHTFIPKVPSFDYLNAPPDFYVKQSCNGLLLCSSKPPRVEYTYYICNPTTKHFKRLSPPACEFKQSLVSMVCMAFDPLKSSHYKLICIRRVTNTGRCQIDVYSSETDSWRPSGITFTMLRLMYFLRPVFCNGAVHWYSIDETSVYFDVDTECFNTMPMPNLSQRVVLYFGESRGHLHLIVTKLPLPSQFDVLEMAADYSGWFVRYHVNIDDLRIAFPGIIWDRKGWYRYSVMHVIRAQKEEESIVVVSVDNKAISYNFHDGTSKKHCDLELHPKWNNTFQYFESLTYV